MTEEVVLRGEPPWKLAGRWIALFVAVIFGVFASLLVLTSGGDTLPVWLGFFVAVEASIYLFSGPFYRPRVISVKVQGDGITVRNREEEEARVPFSDVRRIASSFAACTLVARSGMKYVLGFGFGGANGDVLMQHYKVWAVRNVVDLMEFNTRDGISSRPVKNLEVYERRRGD